MKKKSKFLSSKQFDDLTSEEKQKILEAESKWYPTNRKEDKTINEL